ncbi:MAG: MHS family MFS transporter [Acidobacteria bacterium]|nr:MHS family MFS transporter [Acidobacteriota bacterium]
MAEHAPAPKQTEAWKVLAASLVGSSIEWYDFFLYGTVSSLVFSKVFFPGFDPATGLLYSYATFAVPFFVRPLGGVVFSHIGDRSGRKNTLIATLSLMGAATFLIGVLPGYDTLGFMAPLLLVLLRMVQGLGIGGEWGGALLLAVEYAPPRRRGLYGSVPQMGVTIGMLMGTLSMSLMTSLPEEDFMSWGWRVPFVLSIVLVALGLAIRRGIGETPAFREARSAGRIARVPLFETVRHEWRSVLVAVGAKVVETAPFYIFSTFILSYGTVTLGFSKASVLSSVSAATLVGTLLIVPMGRLSDTVGRRKVYVAGTWGMVLYPFAYFFLLSRQSVPLLYLATILGLGVLWAPVTAVLGTLFSEIFRTQVRYTGVTIGYQLGAALAGGTAPFIATALLQGFDGSSAPIAVYMMLTGLISLLTINFGSRRHNLEFQPSPAMGVERNSGRVGPRP